MSFFIPFPQETINLSFRVPFSNAFLEADDKV